MRWPTIAFSTGLCLVLAVPGVRAQTGSSGGGGLSALGSSGSSGGLNSLSGGGGGASSSSLTGSTPLSSGGGVGSSKGIGSGNLSALGTSVIGLNTLGTNTTGGGTGSSAYPTVSDPYVPFFANPLQAGIGGTGTSNTFGQPTFAVTTTTNTLTASQAARAAAGFTTVGLRKAPSYVTTVSDELPLIKHAPAQLEQKLLDTIRRSSTLSPKDAIRVQVEASGLVQLSGSVVSERDRRLAESLVRFTPGVQDVRNLLEVTK